MSEGTGDTEGLAELQKGRAENQEHRPGRRVDTERPRLGGPYSVNKVSFNRLPLSWALCLVLGI